MTSRVSRTEEWTVVEAPETVRARLQAHGRRLGVRVEESGEGLGWSQGSGLKTRFYGAWNVDPSVLPCRATLGLASDGGGTRVRARLDEAMGFGYFDGKTKERYEAHLAASVGQLKRVAAGEAVDAGGAGDLTPSGRSAQRWVWIGIALVLLSAILRALR